MNFQQLRIVRETARQKFNLTDVANALHTSQSGVSKHIKDLEDELGVELYVRKGKRLLGHTLPGQELVKIVERMLLDASNIKTIADQYSNQDTGLLTIAATHTQARYTLPRVVTQFKARFPNVHLKLLQGSPKSVVDLLISGEADIGFATESLGDMNELLSFPLFQWHHVVVTPKGHALTKRQRLTLEDIAEFPIITYHEGFTGRANIEKAFREAGVIPDIVLSALDADVIKTYVELGLGIGIIASMAYAEGRDVNLSLLPGAEFFPPNETKLAIRRGHFMRRYAYQFIEMCSPELTEQTVLKQVDAQGGQVLRALP